jgi:tripartite-type tricarboxylate transporter receptor subunit TctC
MTSRRSLVRSIVAAPLALSSARLWAQAWPARPVRIVVPFAPGGSTDAIGRMLAAKLTEQLGTNVLVENKAGANSIIGTTEVAKSAPDGHTLLLVTPSLVINPLLVAKLPFDPARDLVPVTQVSRTPYVVGVSNEVPAGSLRELIAYAKANPGKLAYASGGNKLAGKAPILTMG